MIEFLIPLIESMAIFTSEIIGYQNFCLPAKLRGRKWTHTKVARGC